MTSIAVNIFTTPCIPLPDVLRPVGNAADRFEVNAAMIGVMLGMQQIGCNLFALPAGKRAFPFHNHHASEEVFIIIEGQGEFRLGPAIRQVGPGDVIFCPAGGSETAHQLINSGTAELRYLAVSSKPALDIIEYPDSGKFRAMSMTGSGFDAICGPDDRRDYWEGE